MHLVQYIYRKWHCHDQEENVCIVQRMQALASFFVIPRFRNFSMKIKVKIWLPLTTFFEFSFELH